MVPRVLPACFARHHAGRSVRRDGVAAPADLEAGVDQPQQQQEAGYRAQDDAHDGARVDTIVQVGVVARNGAGFLTRV